MPGKPGGQPAGRTGIGQTRAVSPRTENRLQDYSHFPYIFPVKSRCGALHCGGFFLLFKVSFC
ncbi:hypothetical protein B5F54_14325 [Anaeromassilibacillus sp. An250]|nr:hypothetical protein B5F54_14325 [Anaeromassilibacillus sp. An250]